MNILLTLMILLGFAAEASGGQQQDEEPVVTITASFPAQKGVYNELRSLKHVRVGSLTPPSAKPPPRLSILSAKGQTAFRVEASQEPGDVPVVQVDDVGRMGIHIAPDPERRLTVQGSSNIDGDLELGELTCTGCVDTLDVDPRAVQQRVDNDGEIDDDPTNDSGCSDGHAIQKISENGTVTCIRVSEWQPK